jgi:hypothetical protein
LLSCQPSRDVRRTAKTLHAAVVRGGRPDISGAARDAAGIEGISHRYQSKKRDALEELAPLRSRILATIDWWQEQGR